MASENRIIYKHIDLIDFKKYRYYFLGIIILCFVVNIVITLIYSSIEQKFYDNFLTYKSILCIIASVLTFIYIYCILENKPNKIIEFMARDSFEIYLVHGIILDLVMLNTPFKNEVWSFPFQINTSQIFVIDFKQTD